MKWKLIRPIKTDGQVLVLFVLVLPVLLLFLFLVIGYGIMTYEKNRLDSITKDVCSYALKEFDESKIHDLINRNDENIIVEKISREKDEVTIKLVKKIDVLFLEGKLKVSSKVECDL